VADHYRELIEKAQEKDSKPSGPDRGLDDMLEREEEEDLEGVRSRKGAGRSPRGRGSAREAEIQGVEVLDEKGEPASEVPSGSKMTVRVRARYAAAVEESALGVTLRSKRAEVDVFSTDTTSEGTPLGRREAGEEATVDFTFEVPLRAGNYTVGANISGSRDEGSYLDRMEEATSFRVARAGISFEGLVRLPTQVEIHDPEGERERPTRSA
jgi:hypothetical protein